MTIVEFTISKVRKHLQMQCQKLELFTTDSNKVSVSPRANYHQLPSVIYL